MAVAEVACSWSVTTAPVLEPLMVDDVKSHARITDNDSDHVLELYIKTAREAAEAYMGRGILTQSVTAWFSDFANVMPLPLAAPLASVTSVKYYDTTATLATLDASVYDVDTSARPGRVVLAPAQSWPSLQSDQRDGRVQIVYVVGWTTAALVPELIKHGIRMYVSYLDLDRAGLDVRAMAAKEAAERCWSDRIWWTAPQL